MDLPSSPPQTVGRASHLLMSPLARVQERGRDRVARRLGILVFLHDQERNWCGGHRVSSATFCLRSSDRVRIPRLTDSPSKVPFLADGVFRQCQLLHELAL